MTADVVAFLRAALDEVERAAESASNWREPEQWTIATDVGDRHNYPVVVAGGLPDDGFADPLTDIVARGDWIDEGEGRVPHIALHDPRAALARVESERAILEEYEKYRERLTSDARIALDAVVWTLAHGHRHTVPGFDPAWAPEGVSADA